MRIDELETPALTSDLDAVERTVAAMQGYCDEHGLALRPHVKMHKLPEVARLQIDAGVCGITCQKLGEAEVMADAGFDDADGVADGTRSASRGPRAADRRDRRQQAERERAIVDAGSKTLTSEPAVGVTGYGHLLEHPKAAIYELHEEHGFVDVGACERLSRSASASPSSPTTRVRRRTCTARWSCIAATRSSRGCRRPHAGK